MEGMWPIFRRWPLLSFHTSSEGHGWHSANPVWNSIVLYLPLQLQPSQISALENSYSASRKQSKDKILQIKPAPFFCMASEGSRDDLLPCHWPVAKRGMSSASRLLCFPVPAGPALSGTEATLPHPPPELLTIFCSATGAFFQCRKVSQAPTPALIISS